MSLRELLEEHRDDRFVFVSPGGNQGDHMIYLGAYKLADKVGFRYLKASFKKKKKNKLYVYKKDVIIYLQGGGGFNSWWNWTPHLLNRLREANPKSQIIIGPTTVDTDRDYLDLVLDMDDRMTFFARERTTFDIMTNYCVDVRLDHDTALHLRPGDGYLDLLTGDLRLRKKFSLLVLRKDPESRDLPISIRVEDFKHVLDPCRRKDWARWHMHAKTIVANRSHSAIMGAILGKHTSIFAGKYHKNKSIWEYSLKNMGVKWIE